MIALLPILFTVLQGHSCHSVDTEQVFARDVVFSIPAFAQLPPEFLLGYVASSGVSRVFKGSDLERIAKNRGIELHGLPDLCFTRRTSIPSEGQIREAMLKSLDIANAKIDVVASPQKEVPSGELIFPRNGVQAPVSGQSEFIWHGYVRHGENARVPVWARVRVTAIMTRVIAAADIAPGKEILPSQLRVETTEDSPLDETVVRDLSDVSGYAAKASLRAGSVIRKSQLERPNDVTRGEIVRVEVFEGAAHLMIEGLAQSSGMKGASILVRNPGSGKDFRAQVTGKGLVTIGEPKGNDK
jgi:flagella basal body P-ring formation protein FlgA